MKINEFCAIAPVYAKQMHQDSASKRCVAPVPSNRAESRPVLNCPATEDIMLDPKIFEDFGARMSALLANGPAADLEKNAKALLGGFFDKLDLVTREEFDVQAQVLARTRQKLKELEARVEALEKARDNA